jgi:hypothetical protein
MTKARYRSLACSLLLMIVAYPWSSPARQLSYSQQSINAQLQLKYRFEVPHARRTLALAFALPSKAVRASQLAFRRFNPRDLERRWATQRTHLVKQELQHLQRSFPDASIRLESNGRINYKISPNRANQQLQQARTDAINALVGELRRRYPHVRITYQARNGRVEMSGMRDAAEQRELNTLLKSRMRALEAQAKLRFRRVANQAKNESRQLTLRLNHAIDRVHIKLDGFEQEYLEARYYKSNHRRRIQPDYGRIARESLATIEPLVRAWAQHHALAPSREAINQLLGFFQSIPYDTLESRNSTDGAGFAMPVALLARNRGDCDTKSVAMATMVHALAPEIPIVMVLLAEHALLGFAIETRPGDATLKYSGRTYVLAEPVGPALKALGKIAKSSSGRAHQLLQLFEPAALQRN